MTGGGRRTKKQKTQQDDTTTSTTIVAKSTTGVLPPDAVGATTAAGATVLAPVHHVTTLGESSEVVNDEVELLEDPPAGEPRCCDNDHDDGEEHPDGDDSAGSADPPSASTVASRVFPAGVNAYGGQYKLGATFSYEKKKEVAAKYRELVKERRAAAPRGGGSDDDDGGPHHPSHLLPVPPPEVSVRALAAAAQVSVGYARKVLREIKEHGDVQPPVPPKRRRGPGTRTLTDRDQVVLMQLHAENPKRMTRSYQQELFVKTGTTVSEACMSRWLQQMFPSDGPRVGRRRKPDDPELTSLWFPRSRSTTSSAAAKESTGTGPDVPAAVPAMDVRGGSGPNLEPTPANLEPTLTGATPPSVPNDEVQDAPEFSRTEGSPEAGPKQVGTTSNGEADTIREGDPSGTPAAAAAAEPAAAPAPPPPQRQAMPVSSNSTTTKRRKTAARATGLPRRAPEVMHVRTQVEARLLEAAYFVRPLLTPAALTSGRASSTNGNTTTTTGADCFPKKQVQNAYEYLLQDPEDADRFVESFVKGGIGKAMLRTDQNGGSSSAGVVEGGSAAGTATITDTNSKASPYGVLVDLCAAGYVNRIVSSGKPARMLTDPNPPTSKPLSGARGAAKAPTTPEFELRFTLACVRVLTFPTASAEFAKIDLSLIALTHK